MLICWCRFSLAYPRCSSRFCIVDSRRGPNYCTILCWINHYIGYIDTLDTFGVVLITAVLVLAGWLLTIILGRVIGLLETFVTNGYFGYQYENYNIIGSFSLSMIDDKRSNRIILYSTLGLNNAITLLAFVW